MSLVFICSDGSYEVRDWYLLLKHSVTIKTMILFDLQQTNDISYEDIIIDMTIRLLNGSFNNIFNLNCSKIVFADFMDMLRTANFTNSSLINNPDYDYIVSYLECIDYIAYYNAMTEYNIYVKSVCESCGMPSLSIDELTRVSCKQILQVCYKDVRESAITGIKTLIDTMSDNGVYEINKCKPYINKIIKILNINCTPFAITESDPIQNSPVDFENEVPLEQQESVLDHDIVDPEELFFN